MKRAALGSAFRLLRTKSILIAVILCAVSASIWYATATRPYSLSREETEATTTPVGCTGNYQQRKWLWVLLQDGDLWLSYDKLTYPVAAVRSSPHPAPVVEYEIPAPAFLSGGRSELSRYQARKYWGFRADKYVGMGFESGSYAGKEGRFGWRIDLSVPIWPFVAAGCLFILWRGMRVFRSTRLLLTSKCEQCGYDLRAHASGDNCPECGTAVPAKPST